VKKDLRLTAWFLESLATTRRTVKLRESLRDFTVTQIYGNWEKPISRRGRWASRRICR
jgi:hypothetical protein